MNAVSATPRQQQHVRPRRLSPSALNRYVQCPRAFRYHDIERLRRDEVPSPILCQGNATHHALERFYGLSLEHRTPENLERSLRSVWPEHRRPGTFSCEAEEAEYGRATLAMLAAYAENNDLSIEPLAREQWLSLRLESGVELYGKVDRVDQGSDGGLVLVDYKTGRRQLDPSAIGDDIAVQLYTLAAQATYRKPVERVQLLYLQSGDEVRWEPTPEELDLARRRLEALVETIANDENFVATPGGHCRFCPFALHCADRQRVELSELQPVEGLGF